MQGIVLVVDDEPKIVKHACDWAIEAALRRSNPLQGPPKRFEHVINPGRLPCSCLRRLSWLRGGFEPLICFDFPDWVARRMSTTQRNCEAKPRSCLRAREERESGGVESGKAALNTPISPLFGAEALLRRPA
jgi:hypothetical protein